MTQFRSKLEQVLEYLVNNESEKAQEMLHDVIVEKARGIHEEIVGAQDVAIEKELVDETSDESVDAVAEAPKDKEDKMKESSEESEDDKVEEKIGGYGDQEADLKSDVEKAKEAIEANAEEIEQEETNEADDDMEGNDDAMGELEAPEGDAEEGKAEEMEDKIDDLEDSLEELKAEFEKMIGGDSDDDEASDDMPGEEMADEATETIPQSVLPEGKKDKDDKMEEAPKDKAKEDKMDEATSMTPVSTPSNNDDADNKSSVVADKNDMGGTSENIVSGKEDTKPSSPAVKDMSTGNVNVAGNKKAPAPKPHAAPKVASEKASPVVGG